VSGDSRVGSGDSYLGLAAGYHSGAFEMKSGMEPHGFANLLALTATGWSLLCAIDRIHALSRAVPIFDHSPKTVTCVR
jgi:hypothetical protein